MKYGSSMTNYHHHRGGNGNGGNGGNGMHAPHDADGGGGSYVNVFFCVGTGAAATTNTTATATGAGAGSAGAGGEARLGGWASQGMLLPGRVFSVASVGNVMTPVREVHTLSPPLSLPLRSLILS